MARAGIALALLGLLSLSALGVNVISHWPEANAVGANVGPLVPILLTFDQPVSAGWVANLVVVRGETSGTIPTRAEVTPNPYSVFVFPEKEIETGDLVTISFTLATSPHVFQFYAHVPKCPCSYEALDIYEVVPRTSQDVRVADFDDDGRLDIFIANDGPEGTFIHPVTSKPYSAPHSDRIFYNASGTGEDWTESDAYGRGFVPGSGKGSYYFPSVTCDVGNLGGTLLPDAVACGGLGTAGCYVVWDGDQDLVSNALLNPANDEKLAISEGLFCRDVAIADLNADGKLDVWIATGGSPGSPKEHRSHLGFGDLIWFGDTVRELPSTETAAIAVGDLDNDADLDVLAVCDDLMGWRTSPYSGGDVVWEVYKGSPAEIMVWENSGDCAFMPHPVHDPAAIAHPSESVGYGDVVIGDLDGDGLLDAVILANGTVEIWRNTGDLEFVPNQTRLGGPASRSLELADVDGDGRLDVIVANHEDAPSALWMNRGNLEFVANGAFPGGFLTEAHAAGDLNDDGLLDIVEANSHHEVEVGEETFRYCGFNRVLLGRADTFCVRANPTLQPVDGQPRVVIEARACGGSGMITYSWSGPGDAASGGDASLQVAQPGSYSVTATDQQSGQTATSTVAIPSLVLSRSRGAVHTEVAIEVTDADNGSTILPSGSDVAIFAFEDQAIRVPVPPAAAPSGKASVRVPVIPTPRGHSTPAYVSVIVGGTPSIPVPFDVVRGILFMRDSGSTTAQRDAEIWVMNPDGSSPTQLTENEVSDLWPSWSPDGTRIALTRAARDATSDVHVIAADGSEVGQITVSPADDRFPCWSPSGDWIAFESDRDGDYEILKAQICGEHGNLMTELDAPLVQLTDNSVRDAFPAWSDSGLAYSVSSTTGYLEIWGMEHDGSRRRRVVEESAWLGYPAWSPSGDQLAFCRTVRWNSQIRTVNLDGSNEEVVSKGPGSGKDWLTCVAPSWSPDGTELVFTATENWWGVWHIWKLSLETGELTQLTSFPDGAAIVGDWAS